MAYFSQVNHTRKGSGYTMADIQALTGNGRRRRCRRAFPRGTCPEIKFALPKSTAGSGNPFPQAEQLLWETLSHHPHQRAVVAVCGGSGVGKSEIASLLSYYLNQLGVGSYTLSGDNYPHPHSPGQRRGAPAGVPGGRSAGADRRGRVYPGDRRYPAGNCGPGTRMPRRT